MPFVVPRILDLMSVSQYVMNIAGQKFIPREQTFMSHLQQLIFLRSRSKLSNPLADTALFKQSDMILVSQANQPQPISSHHDFGGSR